VHDGLYLKSGVRDQGLGVRGREEMLTLLSATLAKNRLATPLSATLAKTPGGRGHAAGQLIKNRDDLFSFQHFLLSSLPLFLVLTLAE